MSSSSTPADSSTRPRGVHRSDPRRVGGGARPRRPVLVAVGCLVERYRDELAAELPEVDLCDGFDGAPAGGARRGRGGGRRASGGERGACTLPATPGERLRQDLGRLRPPLFILRDPADQGRLRAGNGRRGAPVSARGSGCRRARAGAGRPRTRRGGRSPAAVSRLLGELARFSPARSGCACSTSSRTASIASFWRPWRRTRCPTWTSPFNTPPAPSCADAGAPRRRRAPGPACRACPRRLARRRDPLQTITGFPGETDAEFEELVSFVRSADLAVAVVSSTTSRRAPPRPVCPGPFRAGSRWSAPRASER